MLHVDGGEDCADCDVGDPGYGCRKEGKAFEADELAFWENVSVCVEPLCEVGSELFCAFKLGILF